MGSPGRAFDLQHIASEVKDRLAAVPAVESIHFLPTESALSVWVGITQDSSDIRRAIYAVEDDVSELFSAIVFDFHVVPIPAERKMEDYVAEAHPIFRRSAA